MDPESTFEILKSILTALVHLDSLGIMHRDLKPNNIILRHKNSIISKNTVKLVDFGLASRCDIDQYIFNRCGTPGFIAPEIINLKRGCNKKQTTKCDIFSTGIIFFWMLTGKSPFEGKNVEKVLKNNQRAIIDFSM